MMRQLAVLEPGGRPVRREFAVADGGRVTLYVLPLHPDAPAGLRRTVLRREGMLPPAGARRVMDLKVESTGLLVEQVGERMTVELLRSEFRSQVVAGIRLPLHARLELLLPDHARVACAVVLASEMARGASMGVAGSGTRVSRVQYAADNVWWLITDSKGLFVTFFIDVWDKSRDRLMKLGIDGRALAFLTGLILSSAIAYWQYSRANEATARADDADEALVLAQAAQAASLQAQATCLAERQALVTELQDKAASAALAIERALSSPLSIEQSIVVGGASYAAEPVVAWDDRLRPRLIPAVQPHLGTKGDSTACLTRRDALGRDLPAWLLSWSPDPAGVCQSSYRRELGTVELVGPFGLSKRLARDFGDGGYDASGMAPEAMEDVLGEARQDLRWSAFTLAAAMRTAFEQIVDAPIPDRVIVAPSQAQLWALALVHAFNLLPSPAEGALDQPLDVCIGRLLDERLAGEGTALAGQPVLPDAVALLAGEATLTVTPTGGCGWTDETILQGLEAALQAVARLAGAAQSGAPTVQD